MDEGALRDEWCLLQNQFDSYEKYSLVIKLVNVVIITLAYLCGGIGWFVLCIALVLWMQDAVWKTFQSRIEQRLLQLETALGIDDQATKACQFNSLFIDNRASEVALLIEYLRQAVRPTVAFPHAVLIALIILIGAAAI